jgi:hypothetical protein
MPTTQINTPLLDDKNDNVWRCKNLRIRVQVEGVVPQSNDEGTMLSGNGHLGQLIGSIALTVSRISEYLMNPAHG